MKKIILLFNTLLLCHCTNTRPQAILDAKAEKVTSIQPMAKSSSYFRIAMQGLEKENGIYEITAYIVSQRKIGLSEIQWKLPNHLTITEGDLNSQHDFSRENSTQVSITLKTSELQDKDQIFLVVSKDINGENHGASQSYIFTKNASDVKIQSFDKLKKKPKYFE